MRRGSVLFITGGILLAVFLFASVFFQHMRAQNRQTHRQGEMRITGSFAHSLALLATHKIQFDILKKAETPLRKYLSQPLSRLEDLMEIEMNLEDNPTFTRLVTQLKEPAQDLGDFQYWVFYYCSKTDFQEIGLGEPYPREKKGLVHLRVKTRWKKRNDPGDGVTEEFNYAIPVKVTAALIPVLSKFNLYIEDAIAGGSPWKYNLVSTTPEGELKPPDVAKPLLLNNGDPAIQNRLNEFVLAARGLVYLGGGKMFLNLARGWGSSTRFGEGFHFFAAGVKDGLYTIRWEGNNDLAILNWDQGICNEITTSPSKDWWEFIDQSPAAKYARSNSIFHLFGNEMKQSPTLVLGQVYRCFIRARAFKTVAVDGAGKPLFRPGFLPYIADLNLWQACFDPGDPTNPPETINLVSFANVVGLTNDAAGMAKYQRDYASNLGFTPYNTSLAYMATRNLEAFPLQTFGGDGLSDYMKSNPLPSEGAMHDIPEPFRILPGVSSLKSMEAIWKGMNIPGSRVSWIIKPAAEGCSLLDGLRKRGLLRGRKLDLNGWVYVEGDTSLDINENLELVSNGGIVLEKGNITIQNTIKFQDEGKRLPVLQLATKDGDILVNYNGSVDCALASRGKVRIGTNGRPTIRGAMAMARFDVSSASQGAELQYNPALAARPGQKTKDEGSESDLLTFSLDRVPVFLQ